MSSTAAPSFDSLSHVSLPCRDFEEAKRFFTEVLGARLLLDVGDFAEVDIAGAVFGMSQLGGRLPAPDQEYPHYAFWVDKPNMLALKQRLAEFGIPSGPLWTRHGIEALMFFKDPSGNLFEVFCREFEGAEDLPRNPSPRGHGAIVDLASLNYDRWGA